MSPALVQADALVGEKAMEGVRDKTVSAPLPGSPDPGCHFSLAWYYHPNRVSSANPIGIPYAYSPNVNPEVISALSSCGQCIAAAGVIAPQLLCASHTVQVYASHTVQVYAGLTVQAAANCS
jgi:hypothetical protein